MTDLSKTIAPKSDQLNADDLIGGPMTISVAKVTGNEGDLQPISIHFEGDNGRPYKPCKSMRRVMVAVWGKDGNQYPGRSMTLFCDPSVKFGGIAVGGVRISHMSHMDSDISIGLTATRGQRKPFHVKRLVIADDASITPDANPKPVDEAEVERLCTNFKTCETLEELSAMWGATENRMKANGDVAQAKDERKAELIRAQKEAA